MQVNDGMNSLIHDTFASMLRMHMWRMMLGFVITMLLSIGESVENEVDNMPIDDNLGEDQV
jgi:hypothetical protein